MAKFFFIKKAATFERDRRFCQIIVGGKSISVSFP